MTSSIIPSAPSQKINLKSNTGIWLFWIVWLAIILFYVAVSLSHLNDYAGDYDEGVIMQTALLSRHGFPLYEAVTLNKPPLLTWWIRLFFEFGGVSVPTARLGSLFLSTIGLVLLGALGANWWQRWAGPVVMICFLLLPESIVRATLVTNDLPGMTMMLAALLTASHFRQKVRLRWLALSGVFFALGFGFHPVLFYMLVPVALILISTAVNPLQWRRLVFILFAFGGTAVLLTFAWLLLIDWRGFATWVIEYNMAPLEPTLAAVATRNWQKIGVAVQEQFGLVLLALASAIWLLRHRPFRLWAIISLAWLGVTVLTLSQLNPMWEHYLIFLTYPLVLLAGGGLVTAISQFNRSSKAARRFAVLLGFFFLTFAIPNLLTPRAWTPWTNELEQARNFLQNELLSESFVISDEPFLIFASGHLVPPTLADSSSKRISTGFLQVSDVINAGLRRQVSYGLWGNGRFQQLPELTRWAEATADMQSELNQFNLYHFKREGPQQRLDGRLEPNIQLNGYSLHSKPGKGEIHLTLYWETEVNLEADFKIFTHILDADGELISQYDADPQQGWLPTSEWEIGVLVPHTAVIPLPQEVPSTATIVAGMYTWPEIERLPAFAADGSRLANDAIPVTTHYFD